MPNDAHAWGKRGHQIVGEVAALVASDTFSETQTNMSSKFLKDHSYDFGFYNNVPDIVWKKPATFETESTNHFMDMEIFERAFKKNSTTLIENFKLSRKEFDQKYPNIKQKAGRSFWRIKEILSSLEKTTLDLKKSTTKIKNMKPNDAKKLILEHRKLQERWLVLAGVMGHYMADLAQPLHVTENYDGQLSGQEGFHHIYETEYVDQLYPSLLSEVFKKAKKQWPKFKKQNSNKTPLELMMYVTESSTKDLSKLLAKDKKLGRKDPKSNAKKFKSEIEDNLVLGSLALAEIYRRNLGWKFFGEKFYFFDTTPAFIKPE